MIRQAIEIGKGVRIDRLNLVQADRQPLGAAHRRPGKMERRDRHRSAGQDEAGQWRKRRVHRVDFLLEAGHLAGDDAQRMFLEIAAIGRGDVGAEIEHLVLDAAQADPECAVLKRGDGNADRRVGLIDLTDRGDARTGLADPAAVDQPGAAFVAGARVNLVELDQC